MMNEKKSDLEGLMSTTLQNIKAMVDVNTIVGQPITTPDGVTLIPISQVSLGFGSGGSTFGKDAKDNFGGGAGAGVKIEPVAFLVVKEGSVRLLPVGMPPATTAERVAEAVPQVVDKVTAFLEKRREKKEDEEEG